MEKVESEASSAIPTTEKGEPTPVEKELKKYLLEFGTRKATLPTLYYLTRTDDYVQQQQIADWIGVHPRSVAEAIVALQKHPLYGPDVEMKKVGSAALYRLKQGETRDLLKKIFDLMCAHIEKEVSSPERT